MGYIVKSTRFLPFIISSMLSSLPVIADELTTEKLFQLSLEELLQVKVTSSTLYDESIQSVPSSVTVIKHDEIKRLGINRLTELMNYVPGYQSYQLDTSNLTQSFSSRGHRITAVIREVLILIDGHRINSDWTGGTTFFNAYLSMDNVEQVEFIRGPGSAIYGSNAFLGVINIKTKGKNQISLSGGSNDSHKGILQTSTKSGEFEFSLFAKDDKDHGDSLSIFNPSTNSFTNTHDPSNNQEAYLTLRNGGFEANARWVKREMEEFYNGGFVSNDFNERINESYFIDLNYSQQTTENLVLNTSIFLDHKASDLLLAQSETPLILFDSTAKEEEIGLSIIAKYNSLESTRWLTGFEIRKADVLEAVAQATGALNTSFPLTEETHRTIRGLFGQYQSQLTEETSYVAGARLDDYSDTGSHFSPRLGLIQTINSTNTLKLLYGEAFRAPSRLETDLVNAPGVQGNPNLNPEISKTIEFIWVYSDVERLITSTIFDTRIEDSIVETTNTIPRKFVNGSDKTIAGLEVELQQEIGSNWHLRFATTHIFDEFSKINSESSNLLSASVSYSTTSWSANISSNYQGEKFTENLSSSGYTKHGGYTLFNTTYVYQPDPNWEVFGKVRNLFDKDFNSPSQSSLNTEGVQNRGRTAEVGFRWNFK